jgi:hypothetical protein
MKSWSPDVSVNGYHHPARVFGIESTTPLGSSKSPWLMTISPSDLHQICIAFAYSFASSLHAKKVIGFGLKPWKALLGLGLCFYDEEKTHYFLNNFQSKIGRFGLIFPRIFQKILEAVHGIEPCKGFSVHCKQQLPANAASLPLRAPRA